ncbi:MAG: extracellular solute-binding protein [Limnochordaceae bacterium]|nr:extracellular solute-binding protein [Limnochordaceae bacterium]
MTRKLAVLLALVLVGLLAGSALAADTITLWTKEDVPVLPEIERLAREFSAKTGIQVKVVNYGVEDLRQNFQAAALAGSGPDVLWTVNDHIGVFATAGLIKPIRDVYGSTSVLSRFVKPGIEAQQFDGKDWGIPISVGNHLMLIYNKKMVPKPPQTTDELIALGKKLTKDTNGDGKPDVYGLVYNLNEPFWLAPWLGGFGGWPLDGTTPTLGTKATAEALQFLHDLKFVHKIVPTEADYNTADAMFREGKAAMLINGDWSLGAYKDFGVARIPKVSSTGLWPSPMTSGVYFLFPEYLSGKKLEDVKKLVDFFISPENQVFFATKFQRLPSVAAVLKDPKIANDPILKGSSDQMVVGKPMPTVPEMRCAWDAMRPNLEAVMAGQMKPEDAAAAMQQAAEQCVATLQ